LPATGPDTAGTIVLTAHYDHLGRRSGRIYNGADDNASGVGAMLAVAERLAGQARRHRFVFAALDAEEVGLRGARALVLDGPVDMARVVLNVNLDMISRSDEQILFAAGTNFTPSLRPFVQGSAAEGVDLRFGHDEPDGNELRDWTYASDHGEFHRAGLPYLYFGVDEHPDYHRPTDDFERIDPVFYTAVVETIIAAVKRIDAGWPGPAEGAL
ncbi:MAG: M28 family peptidase, partial [Bacteroidota bacterium]